MSCYSATLEALMARELSPTKEGCVIDASLFSAVADWSAVLQILTHGIHVVSVCLLCRMTVPLLHFEADGNGPQRVGLAHPTIHPYGAYETQGGPVVVSIQNEREFGDFCTHVLLQPDLISDPRFANNVSRVQHEIELDKIINSVFSTAAHDEILSRLQTAGIAYGSINTCKELHKHPALRRCA